MSPAAIRAAAILRIARDSRGAAKIQAEVERGKAYTRALRLYPDHRRAVEWAFADNARDTAAAAQVDRWWPRGGDPPGSILVLAGAGGCGKTTAALRLLVREGGEIVVAKRFHEIPLGEAGDTALSKLSCSRLVVLENAGKESSMGPTTERVCRLIDDCHEKKKSLVITTNLHRDGLDARGNRDLRIKDAFSIRYGEDILDRIDGDGGWVEISDPSMRGGEAVSLLGVERARTLASLLDSAEQIRLGVHADPRQLDALVEMLRIPAETIASVSVAIEQAPKRALAGVALDGPIGQTLGGILDRWRA